MDFDQILDQAIEMLQRRERLTYRTLKRQFELDNVILFPSGQAKSPEGVIECRERLGGLLKYYHRKAA